MKSTRKTVALGALLVIVAGAWIYASLPGASYATQFRDFPNAACSRQFPLGADEIGRDRLTRLLCATRISLLLAPLAALLSTLLAAVIGCMAGYLGGWCDRVTMRIVDLMLSLPWLFLLITVRALLPLNVSPLVSVLITFGLLSLLGWPSAARVVRAGAAALRGSDAVLQARACGCRARRVLLVHVAPNLKPVLVARFCTLVPVFVLSEANLGLLGLGVTEPLPSWGNLLRGFENQLSFHFGLAAPLLLLVIVMSCLQLLMPTEGLRA